MGGSRLKELVIWDWNGTLLNDVDVAFQAMNTMLAKRQLPLLSGLDCYREIFTFPVREYYLSAGLNLEKETFEELAVEWTGLYHQFYPSCGLYPDALKTVQALEKLGVRQVIVSASQQQALDAQVEEQGLSHYFQAKLGISDIYAGGKAGLAGAGDCSKPSVVCGGYPSRLGGSPGGGMLLRLGGSGASEQTAFGNRRSSGVGWYLPSAGLDCQGGS